MQKNEQKERLTDAQRTLVEENIGLAKRIAWKYCALCAQYGMDWNDVFSILNRAKRRGKELPTMLKEALEEVIALNA